MSADPVINNQDSHSKENLHMVITHGEESPEKNYL